MVVVVVVVVAVAVAVVVMFRPISRVEAMRSETQKRCHSRSVPMRAPIFLVVELANRDV